MNPVTSMPVVLNPLPSAPSAGAAPPAYVVGQDGEGH